MAKRLVFSRKRQSLINKLITSPVYIYKKKHQDKLKEKAVNLRFDIYQKAKIRQFRSILGKPKKRFLKISTQKRLFTDILTHYIWQCHFSNSVLQK